MMRPLPSQNPRRRIRRQTATLPREGDAPTWSIPPAPAHLNAEATRIWRELWGSPPAAHWLPDADGPGVARICAMQAEVNTGDPAGAKRLGELRHLSEAFGLTLPPGAGWAGPPPPDPTARPWPSSSC